MLPTVSILGLHLWWWQQHCLLSVFNFTLPEQFCRWWLLQTSRLQIERYYPALFLENNLTLFFTQVPAFQTAQIVDKIRGSNGHQIYLDPKGKIVMKKPNGEALSGVRFFYGCGLPEKAIKAKALTNCRKASWSFMEIFGQEQMEAYGVHFH